MRTIIVDADSLLFVAAAAHETAVQWDADTFTLSGDFDAARARLEGDLQALKERLSADVMVLCLSDYTNPWRKQVLSSYKENRKNIRKPILLKPLRDYCHEKHVVFQRPGLEADDVCGILMTAPTPPAPIVGERVCVSIDKDLKTIPGLHFNWRHSKPDEDPQLIEVKPEEADRNHLTQALTGDSVDGYKGCPGVGPVKANKILGDSKTVPEMWPRVVEAFSKAGLSEQAALVQARVSRICRACDFDFKKREVKLWEPITK